MNKELMLAYLIRMRKLKVEDRDQIDVFYDTRKYTARKFDIKETISNFEYFFRSKTKTFSKKYYIFVQPTIVDMIRSQLHAYLANEPELFFEEEDNYTKICQFSYFSIYADWTQSSIDRVNHVCMFDEDNNYIIGRICYE